MRVSLLSRAIVTVALGAAASGWLGIRLTPEQIVASAVAVEEPSGAVAQVAVVQPAPAAREAAPGQAPAGDASATTLKLPEGTQPGVRNRAAWQPSPIPAKQQRAQQEAAAPASQPAPGVGLPVPALPGVAAQIAAPAGQPAQPAPAIVVPSVETSIPSTTTHLPPAPLADLDDAIGAATAAGSYTPMSQQFTTEKLEALFNGALPVARGTWVEQHFASKALEREDAYMVWLPPGYDKSAQRYPTLYLLHGVGGPEGYGVEEWLGYALTEDLDRMLALGLIEPMIVVLPNGEQGYWMNHADGGPKWADFVAQDLVRDVDTHFRTDARRERRAIGGLSMGGHGALQLALNHPDLFSIAGAHSPTIRPFETSPEFFGDQDWFAKYDPLTLAQNNAAAERITFWIDVGHKDDEWRPSAEAMRRALEEQHAQVEYRVLEGEHQGWYWEYYLPEYLNFYSATLHAPTQTPLGAPVVELQPLLVTAGVVSPNS